MADRPAIEVTDEMDTGNYVVEFDVSLDRGLRQSKCVDVNNEYRPILERKNLEMK